MKQKFEVKINWARQVHTYYKFGYNSLQALNFACRDLAKKLGMNPTAVWIGVNAAPHSFEVKEIRNAR